MHYLKITDESFATGIAGRPLDEFEAFRKSMALPVKQGGMARRQ